MAATFAAWWQAPVRGMVVTRYGHGLTPGEDAGGIEIVEAGHPSPDEASLAAGARLLELASSLRGEESLYCLVSGGGSALACAPLSPLTVEQKRAAANYLMRRGADIREINCVRKHLSGIKGGRLAAAARPAAVTTWAISDVPGDDPADIASGPTIADARSQADARAILERYDYPDRAALDVVLRVPDRETPKPDDPAFASDHVAVIASAATRARSGRTVSARARIRGAEPRRRSRPGSRSARPRARPPRPGACRIRRPGRAPVRRRDPRRARPHRRKGAAATSNTSRDLPSNSRAARAFTRLPPIRTASTAMAITRAPGSCRRCSSLAPGRVWVWIQRLKRTTLTVSSMLADCSCARARPEPT